MKKQNKETFIRISQKQLNKILVIFILLMLIFGLICYIAGLHDKKCTIIIQEIPPETLTIPSGEFIGPVQPGCDEIFFRTYGYCNKTILE